MIGQAVSVLGVIAAVASAVAGVYEAAAPPTAAALVLVSAVAAAAGKSLSQYTGSIAMTIVGLVVAVAGIIAQATILPSKITFAASVIGVAFAAAGKSLFNVLEQPS